MSSANTGILTYNDGIFEISKVYYSPTAIIPLTDQPLSSLYCFLSRVKSWTNESQPPNPTQDQKYIKEVYKNIFFMKKITSFDMSPVVERIDWVSGDVYAYYRDDVNMFELDFNGTLLRRFYVRNNYDQVFKCLWNNNGAASTVEPIFQPGTFNANQIFQGADDYKWKYLYTISSGSKLKFLDDAWMPVGMEKNVPNPLLKYAGAGSIDVINVVDGGTGYDETVAPVTVVITGDGQYASANVVITSGSITDVTVSNTGTNYTYANVSISSTQGSGANVVAYPSPIGGHGFNPSSELGARHIMITSSFIEDENGELPSDIDFRQIGLINNPYAYFGSTVNLANAESYATTTDFILSEGFGAFAEDETVYQSPDGLLENAYFTATVLSFDTTTNRLRLINTVGAPVLNALVYGNTTQTSRIYLQKQDSEIVPYSGYMMYIENRESVQRNQDSSEIFKFVLGY
jgi:hypothetical protein